ncbi:hypothetical protein QR680_006313 [Steinernema hermaphroditum]|uniref:Uncharacterized protein n=1 Tax=Steinernema hermaphroditum TaxID=289476 RepID=A0AA39LX74_9BILA|nr:hypothetical protein QR680_006313 [Steinernema hermaphroditum]
MGTRVWLFGAVWLIAGALFCCGTSAQTIEINTVGFDNSRKTFSVTERFDRCPQHNFRNNFYHALTCAGFVRAHMDDLERKLKNKTVDWNADIDEKLAENVDKPCYDNAQFKVFYYDENQLIFLRFGEHGSHVSYWITENLQEKYKNNENETVFIQFPHPDEWEFIAYANLGDSPISNHICDPELTTFYARTRQFFFPYGGTLDIKTKTLKLAEACAAASPEHKIMEIDPTLHDVIFYSMTGAELYPYRNMRYFNQMYNRHIIMSFNFPLPGNVQSKKYAVIVYKADEEDRKLVEQKKGVAITMLEPCYIRVNRPDLHESHEMLMTSYSASHRFVILEEDGPHKVQEKGNTIVLSKDYYDDQDAVDIAVRIRMEKLQPVKEKFTSSTHLNAVSFVSLIAAGFVFYV